MFQATVAISFVQDVSPAYSSLNFMFRIRKVRRSLLAPLLCEFRATAESQCVLICCKLVQHNVYIGHISQKAHLSTGSSLFRESLSTKGLCQFKSVGSHYFVSHTVPVKTSPLCNPLGDTQCCCSQ